ncbi:ATP-binding cassette domain-containing protein [Betaproteobacteria bacterium LSUCC0115]|nr:ATP-binding cassette domain-containing protein [Burkholderiales bacterium LSUCC0115]
MVISLSQLVYAWPGQPPLLRIEALTLEAGQSLFVGGPSGSGKSSLLALLSGVVLPTAGDCQVLGQSMASLSPVARDRLRADAMGIVFQQFNLLPYLSMMDNVLLPVQVSHQRLKQSCEQYGTPAKQAQVLFERLGLSGLPSSTPVHRLSVGQQQRVAVARAFMGWPKLVIADEPTSALDDDNRDAFLDLLLGLANEGSTSVVMVSHDRRLADRFDQQLWLGNAKSVQSVGVER